MPEANPEPGTEADDPAGEPGEPRRRGRPPRTEAERAVQRTRLIDAAMDLIRREGADVSIDDLAAAAGVSKPVLYAEFGNKLGVADAIAVELAGRLERQVVAEVVRTDGLDVGRAVRAGVEALINLIDDEPEVYAFVVRSLRATDRGFLDNALVRVIHERAAAMVAVVAPGVPPDHLAVLTDGLFGFAFAAVESWQATKRPPKRELIDALAVVIEGSLGAVSAMLPNP